MQDMLYNMIFKRKSFHIFKDIGTISAAELCEIEEKYRSFLRNLKNYLRMSLRNQAYNNFKK